MLRNLRLIQSQLSYLSLLVLTGYHYFLITSVHILKFWLGGQIMLGEKKGEMAGTTANKILPAENGSPKIETTAAGAGTLLGVEGMFQATYWARVNADGTVYGECPESGVCMTAEGIASFRANGAGAFTEDGGAKFRGTAYFSAAAPSLAGLNGMCLVYEWDVDGEGNATWDLWEWK